MPCPTDCLKWLTQEGNQSNQLPKATKPKVVTTPVALSNRTCLPRVAGATWPQITADKTHLGLCPALRVYCDWGILLNPPYDLPIPDSVPYLRCEELQTSL